MTDTYMLAAIAEAEQGRSEGGIPIGSVIVHRGRIIGRGHNRRVQKGSAILHGEMDALENAGRQLASVYRESVLYTTLSPCAMCSGAILLYGIPRIIIGENKTLMRLLILPCKNMARPWPSLDYTSPEVDRITRHKFLWPFFHSSLECQQ